VRVRTPDAQQQVALVATADDGSFAIALPPGAYLVDALLPDGSPPGTDPISVDVPGSLTLRIVGGAVLREP
jgi:hypothetical protein